LETQAKSDYYQILGVSRSATAQEIESAFQNLAREFHAAGKPRNMDDVEWLRSVNRAHEVLIDEKRRASYDRMGDDFQSDSPSSGYDSAALTQMSWQVDNEINRKRIYGWMPEILREIIEFLRF
jgi:DnaJ-class molecular chaperone